MAGIERFCECFRALLWLESSSFASVLWPFYGWNTALLRVRMALFEAEYSSFAGVYGSF